MYRGLRAILHIDHSVRSRITNEEVLFRANQAAGKIDSTATITNWNNQPVYLRKPIVPISQTIYERRIKLLGHTMRIGYKYGDWNNPEFQCTWNPDGGRLAKEKKRVGRPRHHWTEETTLEAYALISEQNFDEENDIQQLEITSAAINHSF